MTTERQVAELRARIARLERAVEQLLRHTGVQFIDAGPVGISPEVVALVRQGDKLQAIKRQMQLTGCDLATAKAIVETIE